MTCIRSMQVVLAKTNIRAANLKRELGDRRQNTLHGQKALTEYLLLGKVT
jgi:hypothetical protein